MKKNTSVYEIIMMTVFGVCFGLGFGYVVSAAIQSQNWIWVVVMLLAFILMGYATHTLSKVASRAIKNKQ